MHVAMLAIGSAFAGLWLCQGHLAHAAGCLAAGTRVQQRHAPCLTASVLKASRLLLPNTAITALQLSAMVATFVVAVTGALNV